MTAEDERDAANMRANTAATAQMTAEGERDTANMAAAAAATAQMTAEGERDTANMAAAAAATAQMTAEGERDTANMAAAAAATAQMTAEGERDTANMAAAAAATAQMTAEGERDAAITRADTADADLQAAQEELATANARVDEIEEDAADALAEAALKDRIAREVMVSAAFRASTDMADATPLPAEITAPANLIVKRSVAGMVTVDVNGATDDVYTGGETTARSGDWNSVTMTRTDATAEADHTLVIYTDIDAPADRDFNDKYMMARDNIFASDTRAAHLKLARSDSFPAGSSATLTYGEAGGLPKSFEGTFDGVLGNFTCTAVPTCMVGNNAKGELMTVVGEWGFSPHNNRATVKDPDTGYAYFGWWLNKPEDVADKHVVEVFAGGSMGHAATSLAVEIVGNVRYSGPAAGKYVTKTFSAGPQTDAGVGHFTANANLVARFGDASSVVGTTIDGSITGFELDDGSNPGWTVKLLGDSNIATEGAFTGTTEVNFGAGLTDSDDGAAGTWQGAFYGAGATPADAPDAVAGTFDALTANASVIGAFGATKQ